MKLCPSCDRHLDVERFQRNAARPDGLQSVCRVCRKKVDADRYQAKKADITVVKKLRSAELRRRVQAVLSNSECVDCGERDPVVLEFDHVRGEKLANVSDLVHGRAGWPKIVAEIDKCEVRCANCHRRCTHARRNGI